MEHSFRSELLLRHAERRIQDGDLLLFRGQGLIARLIGIAGRSEYTHAARALWWGDTLFCCEVRELRGGRAVTLESQVARRPGKIDVFETNPGGRWRGYDSLGAVRYTRRLAGCDYGYLGVLQAALRHLPIWRFWIRPDMNDQQITSRPPFCSEACALADRVGGGIDPVPHLADRVTEPADLAGARSIAIDLRWRGCDMMWNRIVTRLLVALVLLKCAGQSKLAQRSLVSRPQSAAVL